MELMIPGLGLVSLPSEAESFSEYCKIMQNVDLKEVKCCYNSKDQKEKRSLVKN